MKANQSLVSRSAELLRASPSEFLRLVGGKARRLRRMPDGCALGNVGDIKFEFDFPVSPATVSMMYRRTYQPEVAIAMRRHLQTGGTFVDVGANLGYFTAIGSDLVGREGNVESFEPVPDYAARIARLAELNPDYRIGVHAVAVGDRSGEIVIHVNRGDNVGMNSVVRAAVPDPGEPLSVPVVRLDEILSTRVDLIKIDVEGYEMNVLLGLTGFIEQGNRPAIICEVNPTHYREVGVSDSELDSWVNHHGYQVTDLLSGRAMDPGSVKGIQDVLLVPR